MNAEQKQQILTLIEEEKARLGSYRAVASKCKLSEATISQLRNGTYAAEGDDVYTTIALALGFDFHTHGWVLADTLNYRSVIQALALSKQESLFVGIAHKAGAGKTAPANAYTAENRRNAVFKIDCKEWSGRAFLSELAREVGAELPKGYASLSAMVSAIGETMDRLAQAKPLIILDQANSLKPSALRTLIPLYNQCEDVLGLVAIGTDNLEHEIKRGVRLQKLGYDEIDSRFGRKYIHLLGSNLADVKKICSANGIDDPDKQTAIFHECEPTKVTLEDGRRVSVVEDHRRLKRIIQRERLKLQRHEC